MARILIVDDEPVNRELISAILDGSGHELVHAGTGEEALLACMASQFDLVLLDVMMPGLNGFETTRRLKEQTRGEFLPVILITALADQRSKISGLGVGADEFLTKPIDGHELRLRVSNMLALRSKEQALSARNVELIELHRFREEMSSLIVHDLKNPIAVIMSNLAFIDGIDKARDTDEREALDDCRSAGQRALRLLSNLADVTRAEAGRLRLQRRDAELATLVNPLVQQRAHMAQAREIRLRSSIPGSMHIHADLDIMTRVLENIFDNAMRHTPHGGMIDVAAARTERAVQLHIGNTGTAIPTEARTRIFEKFGQAGAGSGRMNLGLGLYFCRLAAEAHGGRIWLEERPTLPTVFSIELPVATAAA
jgi:two-component system, sensor histidine kinase and response regulator